MNLLKTIALVIFSGLSILVSGLVLGFLDPTFAPYMKKVSVKTEIYLHLTFSFFFFFCLRLSFFNFRLNTFGYLVLAFSFHLFAFLHDIVRIN